MLSFKHVIKYFKIISKVIYVYFLRLQYLLCSLQHISVQTSLKVLKSHMGLLATLLNGPELDLPFPCLCLLSLFLLNICSIPLNFSPVWVLS